MTLDDVLATVAGHVSYLRGTSAVAGDDWVGCDELVSDGLTLERVVRNTMTGFDTGDEAVAASLFSQSYAFRVASVALAAYALDLPAPAVGVAVTAVRIDKPRPTAVAHLGTGVRMRSAGEVADELVAQHLGAFVTAVHRAFPVGERLLWGNVASSCAAVFRAVESSGVSRPPVRARAGEFMAAARSHFEGLGSFTTVYHRDREGWYWDRTSCCLWFRTRTGQLCDNCSLLDPTELHARRRHELAEAS